jgi:hypothetical protein
LLTPSARFKDGANQLARQAFIYVQRHIAMIVIIKIEQVQFLLTIGIVIGIVTVPYDYFRLPGIGGNTEVCFSPF